MTHLKAMQTAHGLALRPSAELERKLHEAHMRMLNLQELVEGSEAKNEIGEKNSPTPNDRMFIGMRALHLDACPNSDAQRHARNW